MTPSLASKTNRFRVLSWLVVALVSVSPPNALPHLISQKTQLALRTKRFHLLSGIPVTIVPGLFHIIHHCRFYKKITCEGEKYCGVFYPLLFFPFRVLIGRFNWYQFHSKTISTEYKHISIPYLLSFVTVLLPNVNFVDCFLYLVCVCYCYCYCMTNKSLLISLKNYWCERKKSASCIFSHLFLFQHQCYIPWSFFYRVSVRLMDI